MIENVHQRELPVPTATVWALIERVAEPGNSLWPAPAWPPMRLDRPLGVGADGGHEPIRYAVSAYSPGRLVEFRFAPATKLDGTHTLVVLDGDRPGSCVLRHETVGTPRGVMRLLWPLMIRWLHDALIEDLLDRAAVAVGHPPAQPARWSLWVRLCRRLEAFLAKRSATAVPRDR